jgi:hypothetical protein
MFRLALAVKRSNLDQPATVCTRLWVWLWLNLAGFNFGVLFGLRREVGSRNRISRSEICR